MSEAQLPEYELGHPGAQRDYLIGRVLSGAKTMTSCLLVQLRMEGEDLPLPGEQYTLVDSRGPQGVVELVEVRLLRLRDVGHEVAVGEGEDYPDVPAWRHSHEAFWADSDSEIAAHLGLEHWKLGDDEIVVVERFRLL